jgi:hypothetical protein
MKTLDQFLRLLVDDPKVECIWAVWTPCSNVLLRLPRVRGLSASMVVKASFFNKEHSYV